MAIFESKKDSAPIGQIVSSVAPRQDVAPMIDDTKETMSAFHEKLAAAQANRDEWLETTPEIIRLLMPRGMGDAGYFCFHGVKVCPYGKVKEIEDRCNAPLGNKKHGPQEAQVISGTSG